MAAGSAAATVIGVAAAVFVTRPAGREFRARAVALATIGQTFPPAAVLALAVPALGFGARPTAVALFLYGLLPVVENSIAGLEGVPASVRDAAEGMGLSAFERLRDIELPLAAPVILAGVRVSVTIAIGTAAIGSTVGALTLGTPIFDGLAANKLPYVIQGAVLVALFTDLPGRPAVRPARRAQAALPGTAEAFRPHLGGRRAGRPRSRNKKAICRSCAAPVLRPGRARGWRGR